MIVRIFFALILGTAALSAQGLRLLPVRTTVLGADSVAIDFQALERNGRSINLLSGDRVSIVDGGQFIDKFAISTSEIPSSEAGFIVILLDVSGSMRFNGKMQILRASASALIKSLSTKDQCALISFSAEPKLLCGFTNDKLLLLERLNTLTAGGYTALYDAVFESMNLLESLPPESNKTIFIFSDGKDEGRSLFTLSDISPRILAMPAIRIHAFDLDKVKPVDDLRRLASLSGGNYVRDPDQNMTGADLVSLVTSSRTTYRVVYKVPTEHTEERREVMVRLDIDGVQRMFTTSYTPSNSMSVAGTPAPSWYYTGSMLAMVTVVIGLIALNRRRKPTHHFSSFAKLGSSNEQRWAPVMLGIPRGNEDEGTRTLEMSSTDEDERTVILDRRPKASTIYGTLLIDQGRADERQFSIDAPEVLIGRSPQCHVQFADQGVSRLHAKLRLEGVGFVAYDLGSANGTFVNSEEVQKRNIADRDVIDIGEHRLEFRTDTTITP